jgi:uncharacterized iron-regulated membrane protein
MAWLRSGPRRWVRRLHRWTGLVLGPLFVLLGLTGSVLVFYVQIDRATEPSIAKVDPLAPVASLQRVLDALERAHPKRDQGWRIEIPPERRGVVTARYLKPDESRGAYFAPLVVSVDPTRGEVVADRRWGHFATTWIYDLHYSLLAGGAGHTTIGIVGLVMTAALAAGVALWWPSRGHWAAALRTKLRAGSAPRRHYDLHKLAGIASLVVLLPLAVTGAALALPTTFEPLVKAIGPVRPMPRVASPRAPDRPLLPIDAAIDKTVETWPGATPRWVDTPASGSALVRVRFHRPGDPSRRFPHNYAWFDGHSGELLAHRLAGDQRSAGEVVLAWLHPLHNGEAFGLVGRWTVFVVGLVPLVLALTGWLRWRDSRRGRRFRVGSQPSNPHRLALGRVARVDSTAEGANDVRF